MAPGGFVVRNPAFAASVEYVVGGNLHQGRIVSACAAGQVDRSVHVDGQAAGHVAFRLVHGRVGGAVDDGADLVFRDETFHGRGVADVEPADGPFVPDVGENEIGPACREKL